MMPLASWQVPFRGGRPSSRSTVWLLELCSPRLVSDWANLKLQSPVDRRAQAAKDAVQGLVLQISVCPLPSLAAATLRAGRDRHAAPALQDKSSAAVPAVPVAATRPVDRARLVARALTDKTSVVMSAAHVAAMLLAEPTRLVVRVPSDKSSAARRVAYVAPTPPADLASLVARDRADRDSVASPAARVAATILAPRV